MEEQNGMQAASAGYASFMRRGEIFLEDEEWEQADAYFEKVLDIDPEHGPAYAGKLCAEFHASTQDALAEAPRPLDASKNYKNALRFGDDALKARLEALNAEVHSALAYRQAVRLYEEEQYEDAAALFGSISGYRDAAELAGKSSRMGGAKADRRRRAVEKRGKLTSYASYPILCMPDGTLAFGIRKNTSEDTLARFDTMSRWTDVVAVDGLSALRADGTVVSAMPRKIDKWRDIVAISGSLGLKADGTVVSDHEGLQKLVSKWQNITAISGWGSYAAGVRADGSVAVAYQDIPGGNSFGPLPKFTDAAAVAITEWHLLVLRADGTVWAGDFLTRGKMALAGGEPDHAAAVEQDRNGTCTYTFRLDVSGWTDIIAIGGRRNVAFGIRSDGTYVMADSSHYSTSRLAPQFAGMQDAIAGTIAKYGGQEILFSLSDSSGLPQAHRDFLPDYELRHPKYFENRRALRAERARKGLCIYCGGTLTGLFTKKCKACGKDNDGGLLDQLDDALGTRR